MQLPGTCSVQLPFLTGDFLGEDEMFDWQLERLHYTALLTRQFFYCLSCSLCLSVDKRKQGFISCSLHLCSPVGISQPASVHLPCPDVPPPSQATRALQNRSHLQKASFCSVVFSCWAYDLAYHHNTQMPSKKAVYDKAGISLSWISLSPPSHHFLSCFLNDTYFAVMLFSTWFHPHTSQVTSPPQSPTSVPPSMNHEKALGRNANPLWNLLEWFWSEKSSSQCTAGGLEQKFALTPFKSLKSRI